MTPALHRAVLLATRLARTSQVRRARAVIAALPPSIVVIEVDTTALTCHVPGCDARAAVSTRFADGFARPVCPRHILAVRPRPVPAARSSFEDDTVTESTAWLAEYRTAREARR